MHGEPSSIECVRTSEGTFGHEISLREVTGSSLGVTEKFAGKDPITATPSRTHGHGRRGERAGPRPIRGRLPPCHGRARRQRHDITVAHRCPRCGVGAGMTLHKSCLVVVSGLVVLLAGCNNATSAPATPSPTPTASPAPTARTSSDSNGGTDSSPNGGTDSSPNSGTDSSGADTSNSGSSPAPANAPTPANGPAREALGMAGTSPFHLSDASSPT